MDSISSIFNEFEISSIKNARRKDRDHPLSRIFFPQNFSAEQVSTNTNRAFRTAFMNDSQWVLGLKPRLVNIDDYSDSSSALGEIRAYGYLREAGILVQPVSRSTSPTPEFLIEENNEIVHLEVHSKQMNKMEAQELENFHNQKFTPRKNQTISTREHVIAPFGKPKQDEITAENAISRIASIKQEEHQLSNTETSILWLDFQDEAWNLLNTVDRVLPVRTWHGAFYSGEFWYAFYGWKGAPIFDNYRLDYPLGTIIQMRHEGRFQGQTKLDAVILSLPRDTLVIENPKSQKPVKPWLWRKLIDIPWFKLEYSYTNWPSATLKKKLAYQRDLLTALSESAYFEVE